MEVVLERVANGAVLVFVVTCMATAGLALGIGDVIAPLRRARLVAAALLANFVFAPAIAYTLAGLFNLDLPHATGLILLGVAAGAPFLPKLAELARGDVAFAVGLMLLLTVGTAVMMPVALPLLVPGMSAGPWPILQSLLVTMLVPLAIGMAIRARWQRCADRLRPATALVSNVSMVLAVVLLIGLNYQAMLGTFGTGAVGAAVVFVLASVVVGFVLGGPAPGTRSVLGLGTGQRNIAAGLIVATERTADPALVIMLLLITLAGLVVLVPAACLFARRTRRAAAARIGILHEEVIR